MRIIEDLNMLIIGMILGAVGLVIWLGPVGRTCIKLFGG